MPDPIRVTRAVRRCPCDFHLCGNCSDGWVNVPVDEECEWCSGDGWGWSGTERGHITCPDGGGSGRRLHDWATGWYWGDTVLWRGRGPYQVDIVDLTNGNLLEQNGTLVLSDPSHRPEPLRWKQ